jgi:hypothetical protein
MRIVVGLSVLMVILLAATAQADDEKEKKISVSDCPKAVQKALKQEVGKGKLVDVDVRTIKGVAIYESEVWYGDLEYEIEITADGKLLKKVLEDEESDDKGDKEGDDKDDDDEDEKDDH